MEHVLHLQRMANWSWRGSPEHAALTAAIASLSAPQPPAEAQPVGVEVLYDRELIAQMLDVCGHPMYTLDAYREQARLLREADNAGAAKVGTGRAIAQQPAAVDGADAQAAEIEALRDGLDYLRQMQGAPDVLELRAKAARAEQLAEALRWIDSDETAKGANDGMEEVEAIKSRAQAALRDHDQENGNG